MGGNDLNLSLSPEEIIFKIKKFVEKINKKYPNTNIGYITIKPSVERKNKLSDIKKINKGVKLIANDFLILFILTFIINFWIKEKLHQNSFSKMVFI